MVFIHLFTLSSELLLTRSEGTEAFLSQKPSVVRLGLLPRECHVPGTEQASWARESLQANGCRCWQEAIGPAYSETLKSGEKGGAEFARVYNYTSYDMERVIKSHSTRTL